MKKNWTWVIGLLCFSFFLAVRLSRSCNSHGSNRSPMEQLVMIANRKCPQGISLGSGTVYVNKLKIEGDYLTYYLSFDFKDQKSLAVIDSLKKDDNLKDGFLISYLITDLKGDYKGDIDSSFGDYLMDMLINNQKGLKIIASESGSDLFSYKATPGQVNAFRDLYRQNPGKAVNHFLRLIIMFANAEVPMDLGEGLLMKEIKVENQDVVYLVELDEDMYDLDMAVIEDNKDEIKQEIMEEFKTDIYDPDTKSLLRLVKACKSNLIYRYLGSKSGKQFELTITHDELDNIMRVL